MSRKLGRQARWSLARPTIVRVATRALIAAALSLGAPTGVSLADDTPVAVSDHTPGDESDDFDLNDELFIAQNPSQQSTTSTPPNSNPAAQQPSATNRVVQPNAPTNTRAPSTQSGSSAARNRSAAGLNVGRTAGALGGARGPQASAPFMVGDLLGLGQTTITFPALSQPGTPFVQSFTTPTSVPISLPTDLSQPASFVSPNDPPDFPSRQFQTTGSATAANTQFQNGQPISLAENPTFTQDVQKFVSDNNPPGTTLPTGQTSAGGGTATFTSGAATLDPNDPNTQLQTGRPIDPATDRFFLTNNYLFTPLIPVGPAAGARTIAVPLSGPAVLGINKLSENTSPLPRDRVFFNYSLFTNTGITNNGPSINRFTPGFEKTFFDRTMSVELRFPFASTISPDMTLSTAGITNTDDIVFGNISPVAKFLLLKTQTWAISAGLQMTVPTAPSLNVNTLSGTRVVSVQNDSFHMMPFVGALYTPDDRFFAQGFFQFDSDTNGSPVSVNPTLTHLTPAGRLYDPVLMYIDLNFGYWMYRDRSGSITGLAPILEFHYNQSLDHVEPVSAGGFVVGNALEQVSTQAVTIGSYLEFSQDTTLALAYVAPLGNGADRLFDGEFRAFVNRRFGGSDRANRIGVH